MSPTAWLLDGIFSRFVKKVRGTSTTKGVRADKRKKEGQQKTGVMVEGNNKQYKVEFRRQPLSIVRDFRMG